MTAHSPPSLSQPLSLAALERRRLSGDSLRPRYHFLPPSGWMNDPNGLIQWKGQYHVFYQHNPLEARWGLIHWGHAVSDDLIHWRDLPIALSPTPEGPDQDGCWSGCAFVSRDLTQNRERQSGENGETPAILYTGGRLQNGEHEQLPCLALSFDDLLSFEKYAGNPVVPTPPPDLELIGFRDHKVWCEDGMWYMLVGAGVKGVGGAALLYRSPDLYSWEYLGPLLEGDQNQLEPIWTGEMWECADFFELGGRRALLLSVHALDATQFYYPMYGLGEYTGHRFIPRTWGYLDVGGHLELPRTTPQDQRPLHGMHAGLFYAPQSFEDDLGRRILLGWISEGRSEQAQLEAGWAGVLSLPRVLTLEGGALLQDPAPELEKLRQRGVDYSEIELLEGQRVALEGLMGTSLELNLTVRLEPAAHFTLALWCSPDGAEQTLLHFDRAQGRLWLDRSRSSLDGRAQSDERGGSLILEPNEALELRVFMDGSVLEVFANRRLCLSSRVYPTRHDSVGIWLEGSGGEVQLGRLEAWPMEDVWANYRGELD